MTTTKSDEQIVTPYTARKIWGGSVFAWTENGEMVPDILAYNVERKLYYQQVRLSDRTWDFAIDWDKNQCVPALYRGRLIFTRHDGSATKQLDSDAWFAFENGQLVRKYTRAEINAIRLVA